MNERKQRKAKKLLVKLKKLGAIKEVDTIVAEIPHMCEVIHSTLPKDVEEIEGIPTPVDSTQLGKQTIFINPGGRLWITTL